MSPRLAVAAAVIAGCGARSELQTSPSFPERLTCGATTVRARAGRGQELVAAVPRALVGRVAWEVVSGPSAGRVTPTGVDRARFWTDVEGAYRVVARADDERCEIEVVVRGTAPGATCPAVIPAVASLPVALDAAVVSAAPVARERWRLETAPAGSARPETSPTAPRGAVLVPDVVGDFVARFEVIDDQGEQDSCATVVRAAPGPGLRVEVWWNPVGRSCPGLDDADCDGADLDLHLLRVPAREGWGSGDDCHFANCNAAAGTALAWGADGAMDDPRLLRDDVRGHGPEVVAVDAPAGSYRVGVHYFAAHGAGAQEATVAVYCRGAAWRVGPVALPPSAPAGGAFWPVAQLVVSDGGCELAAAARDGGAATIAWDDVAGRGTP